MHFVMGILSRWDFVPHVVMHFVMGIPNRQNFVLHFVMDWNECNVVDYQWDFVTPGTWKCQWTFVMPGT
jgi:hypothetical protein